MRALISFFKSNRFTVKVYNLVSKFRTMVSKFAKVAFKVIQLGAKFYILGIEAYYVLWKQFLYTFRFRLYKLLLFLSGVMYLSMILGYKENPLCKGCELELNELSFFETFNLDCHVTEVVFFAINRFHNSVGDASSFLLSAVGLFTSIPVYRFVKKIFFENELQNEIKLLKIELSILNRYLDSANFFIKEIGSLLFVRKLRIRLKEFILQKETKLNELKKEFESVQKN